MPDRQQPRRSGLLVLLALLWAAELWLVQERTTEPTLWHDRVAGLKDQLYRGVLDVGLIATLLLVLRRGPLVVFAVVGFVFSVVVLSYYETYDRAMSVFVVLEQWREGAAVAGGGTLLVLGAALVLLTCLIAKIGLLHAARAGLGRHRQAGAALAVAWLGFVGILDLDHKDMQRLATFEQPGGIAHVYGYLPTWAAELAYVEQDQVVEEAFARLDVRSDRLQGVERPMPDGPHFVLLQVESLDDAVVGFEIEGRPVTPWLNALRERSFYFRSQARKLTGSCDSDFTALMGRLPSPRTVSYRIRDLPFESAVVRAFQDSGYRTASFHGVSGDFFHRRDAFVRMGFDQLAFREEFISARGADPEPWTVSDAEVFEWAAEWPRTAQRTFTLVITATSHLPFDFPTPGMEPVFFPGTQLPNRAYFDAMHYVDASIGHYIEALPEGTVVLLYGDHWSKMTDEELGYEHTVIDGFGLVPVMVHVVGRDVAAEQQTRGTTLALSGELTLLDVFSWAWGSMEPQIAWSPDGPTRPPATFESDAQLATSESGPAAALPASDAEAGSTRGVRGLLTLFAL